MQHPRARGLTGGIVLAGGEGRRFGSPKQLARLGDRPLIEWAVEAMLAVPAIDDVAVVLGAHAGSIRESAQLEPARAVVCVDWREGIAASLRCGIGALREADAVALTLADQPLITPQAITSVLGALESGAPAARATYARRPGHPVAIGSSLFGHVDELRGEVGARELLAAAGAREVECGHLCSDDDIDEPEDLERVRAWLEHA
jgi:molybdenum cofactor cytidylyltransferase